MTIQIGQLDSRVTLQTATATTTAMHERVVTLLPVATVWAKWQDLRGRELMAQGQTQQVSEARCVIRWRNDVTADMRLEYEGKPYAIIGQPIELGRRQYLELMVASSPVERADAGVS